ncbi:MAG: 30S ribosomal protein S6 [Oscillospiraceae bacterium]|nr:30S ribosomal protein S6 [Oscillospiraceae bacterium]
MAKTSEKYEVLYIIDQDVDEEGVKALFEKFTALINEHGAVVEADEWGKRKLAYPINDKPEGYYVLVKFTSGPEFPAELDRVMKITDGVVRSLITLAVE